MKQIFTAKPQEEYLKILGKGMVTIPKAWRDELGIEEGAVVKAQKLGNRLVIEPQAGNVPYRVFSGQQIEEWLKEDKLSKNLAGKVNRKLKFLKGD
ncbi:AbrB/MazE/SpoVT family DNA-binding domain-containing protein [Patescibacteria group bacterium]|nr:AbrB/MazE/SpoVT family DNA-binding domain-containing protein [Patescibacteria group bacterium]